MIFYQKAVIPARIANKKNSWNSRFRSEGFQIKNKFYKSGDSSEDLQIEIFKGPKTKETVEFSIKKKDLIEALKFLGMVAR